MKPALEATRFGGPTKKWKGVHLYRQVHMRLAAPGSAGARGLTAAAAGGPVFQPRPPPSASLHLRPEFAALP